MLFSTKLKVIYLFSLVTLLAPYHEKNMELGNRKEAYDKLLSYAKIDSPEEYKKYGIEDEMLSLKYDKFAGLFVEAIKELKGQNECLQNQINELRKN